MHRLQRKPGNVCDPEKGNMWTCWDWLKMMMMMMMMAMMKFVFLTFTEFVFLVFPEFVFLVFPEFVLLVFPEIVFLVFPEQTLFNWGQDLLEGLSGCLMVFVSWSTVITHPILFVFSPNNRY